MTTRRASVLGGAWLRRWSAPVLGLCLLAGLARAAETAPFAVPEALQKALGWKELPEGNYQPYRTGSVFAVGSEPAQWPVAREQAATWAAAAPALAEKPADYVLRKLARIEALVLNATDKGALEDLRAERKALGETAQALRGAKSADGNDWQVRNMAEQLQQMQGVLGTWLAESPADRIAAFRDEMAGYRPKDRALLVARYGSEARLAELIKMGQELNRLNAAFQAAQQDTTSPEPERKLALRKAGGALGYFYGFNGQDREWQEAMNDPDLKSEIGGGPDGGDDTDYRSLNVPELLSWVNEAEAEKLLVEAYALPVDVQLQAGSRTGALACRLIIEGKLTPKRMPWSLVGWRGNVVSGQTAGEVVALYDVLKKQFPGMTEKKKGGNDWRQRSARAALPVALAVAGRLDEGVAMLGKDGLGESGLPYHARLTEEAATAAWTLALRVPDNVDSLTNWVALTDLAGLAKRSGELTALAAKQTAAAPAGSEKAKIWQARHGWALIGEEKIDEGLALLAPLLEAKPVESEKEWTVLWPGSVRKLLNLAIILPRPELAKAWSDRLAVEFKTPTGLVWSEGGDLFDTFAARELKAGNFALIEEILRTRLTAKPKARERNMRRIQSDEDNAGADDQVNHEEVTLHLADVLARQGRHAEVLTLLAESPHLSRPDLVQLMNSGSGGRMWRPLPLVVAESLVGVGRKDEAVAILEAYLIENGGSDPAYALYTNVRGQDAVPFLQKLWAADHYEERPLIWLATLQLAAGKTAEAETTIKRAIATDPSDGEQPKNDRMRAYAVMRDVELKQGNTKQAEFFAGVLAAIRRSEDADDIAEAGLVDRAIKEYELALESFSDAYCIQSRLARRLAEENRMPEAMEHYKRAFELMPDSFGRVESHCFGCEQAFAGEDAQAVAERVFKEMAAKPDAKPQVQYLLGYLRMEQDRWDEAADYFSKAAAADPEYLNAWRKLAEVLPNSTHPRAEQDVVAFRLLALDPAGKHGGAGEENVRDLPALWRAYAAAGESGLVMPKKLFPLGEKSKKPKGQRGSGDEDGDNYGMRNRSGGTPAERLARHNVLEAITRVLDSAYQWQARPE